MNAQTASTKPATSAALEITASQQWWTNRQASVLESLFGPNVPEADMMAFLHICQATQLDPFRKQIHLIGRRDKHLGRMVFRAQTGIDGFRVIARRSARQSGEVISQEDHLWCGPDGQWSDIWLKAEPPSATKLAVQRGSGRFSAVALWREYAPDLDGKNVGLWRKMPAHMLGKVVEALVLRKAFPNDLSGLFIAEEFGEDSGSGEQKGAGHAGPPGVQARQPTEDERPMVDAASIAVDEAFARGDEAELRGIYQTSTKMLDLYVEPGDDLTLRGLLEMRIGDLYAKRRNPKPAATQTQTQTQTVAGEVVSSAVAVTSSSAGEPGVPPGLPRCTCDFDRLAASGGLHDARCPIVGSER